MQRKRKGAPAEEEVKEEAQKPRNGLRTATRSVGADSDDDDDADGVVVVAPRRGPNSKEAGKDSAPPEFELECPHLKNISYTKTSKTLFDPALWGCAGTPSA